MKKIIPLLLLVGLVGFWWFQQNHKQHPQYSGTIEAEDASLGSKVGGRVVAVAVHEGDSVKPGDALVRLDRDSYEARLREAAADLERVQRKYQELENGSRLQEIQRLQALYEAARQQYQLMKNGPRVEDIRAAKANLEAVKAENALAVLTEKRQQELFEKKNTSAENLDRARKELNVSQNRLKAAEAELERLQVGFRIEDIQAARAQMEAASAALDLAREGTRKEQIDQARADWMRAQATVERAKVDLNETVILAPSAGTVETCRLQPGDLLAPNQTALTMILQEPVWVRIFVPESRLGNASVGREVEVSVKSFPGKVFSGKIVQVNRRAEYTPRNVQTPETRDDLVFGVKIEIADSQHQLRAGMVADVNLPELKP